MDKMKQYVTFTVLGCLAVMAAGWFLLLSPKRAQATELRAEAVSQESTNQQLQTKLQVLKAQAKDLPKQQAKLAAVAARIPDNPALPALVRALVAAGQSAGVELVSMTPGTPVVATAAAVVAAPATPGKPVVAAPRPAAGAGQLASIPLTMNVVGGYFQVEQFVANLENLPRSMRVTTLAVVPGANPLKKSSSAAAVDDGKSLSTTITGQVFMATNRPAATAVTVPGHPVVGTAVGPSTVTAPVAPAKK